jgi:hypothetical protein
MRAGLVSILFSALSWIRVPVSCSLWTSSRWQPLPSGVVLHDLVIFAPHLVHVAVGAPLGIGDVFGAGFRDPGAATCERCGLCWDWASFPRSTSRPSQSSSLPTPVSRRYCSYEYGFRIDNGLCDGVLRVFLPQVMELAHSASSALRPLIRRAQLSRFFWRDSVIYWNIRADRFISNMLRAFR